MLRSCSTAPQTSFVNFSGGGSIRYIRLSGDDDGIRIRPETLEQFLDEQEQLEDDEPEAPPPVPKKEIALKNLTLES